MTSQHKHHKAKSVLTLTCLSILATATGLLIFLVSSSAIYHISNSPITAVITGLAAGILCTALLLVPAIETETFSDWVCATYPEKCDMYNTQETQ